MPCIDHPDMGILGPNTLRLSAVPPPTCVCCKLPWCKELLPPTWTACLHEPVREQKSAWVWNHCAQVCASRPPPATLVQTKVCSHVLLLLLRCSSWHAQHLGHWPSDRRSADQAEARLQVGMNSSTVWHASIMVWGGSRKLFSAMLDMSEKGQGSYVESFLLHAADEHNLKVRCIGAWHTFASAMAGWLPAGGYSAFQGPSFAGLNSGLRFRQLHCPSASYTAIPACQGP